MKTLLTSFFCVLFSLSSPSVLASDNKQKTYTSHKKWGAGDPKKTPAFMLHTKVPVGGRSNYGGKHFLELLPAFIGPSTMNIFSELISRLFMPKLTLEGVLKLPETDEEKLADAMLNFMSRMYAETQTNEEIKIQQKIAAEDVKGDEATFIDPKVPAHLRFSPLTEIYQFAHFYEPRGENIQENKLIIIVAGSKKARLTEIKRTSALARAGYSVLLLDHVVTDHTRSTVGNQLDQSIDAAALNVQTAHLWAQKQGLTEIHWEANSIGSLHVQHALSPGILAKMPEGYIPPRSITLKDCPQPLIPLSFEGSLLREIPLTIVFGKADHYTSQTDVDAFLKNLQGDGPELQNITIIEREGYHDPTVNFDTPKHIAEPYYIADATVYPLQASMPEMQDAVDQAIQQILEDAETTDRTETFFSDLVNPLCAKLSTLEGDGNPFSNAAIYIHQGTLERLQQRLQEEKVLIESYRGSLKEDVDANYKANEKAYIKRFEALVNMYQEGFYDDSDDYEDYQEKDVPALIHKLALEIGLRPQDDPVDEFVENQHLLTHYVLRSEYVTEDYKRLKSLKRRLDEEERVTGFSHLFSLIGLGVSDTHNALSLENKIGSLIQSANTAEHIDSYQSTNLFNQDLGEIITDGRWIDPIQLVELLKTLPKGAIFGCKDQWERERNLDLSFQTILQSVEDFEDFEVVE